MEAYIWSPCLWFICKINYVQAKYCVTKLSHICYLDWEPRIAATHVPWCMPGSLTRGGGENVPGLPGACATHILTYLVRGPWSTVLVRNYSNTAKSAWGVGEDNSPHEIRNACNQDIIPSDRSHGIWSKISLLRRCFWWACAETTR